MKRTFIHLFAFLGAAFSISSTQVTSAQAAAITVPTKPSTITSNSSGAVCDFTQAVTCSIMEGNDSKSLLKAFLTDLQAEGGIFSDILPNNWGQQDQLSLENDYLASMESSEEAVSDGLAGTSPIFSVAYNRSADVDSSNTWQVNQEQLGSSIPFVLALKTGQQVSFNYFNSNSAFDFSDSWDTSLLGDATLWAQAGVVGVPTPALLPGLIATGVAAWRKKKAKEIKG